jgi:mercuric ion transport protein
VPRGIERVADWAGPLGAVFAALCCLGVPFVVAALAAVGMSFLRSDPILWPLMIVSIIVALAGMLGGRRHHQTLAPFGLGVLASSALIAGVIFVHGFPAKELIYAGSLGLIAASIWNAVLRTRCEQRARGSLS